MPFLPYLHPKMLAVLILGLASGLPLALTASTLSVWLSEIGVEKSTIGLFAAVGTPYAFKFLWAPVMDYVPIPVLTRIFGRRSAWLIVTQIFLIVSLIMLGYSDPAEHIMTTAVLALCVAIGSATQDIVIDAYRVEILETNQQGAGATMHVFGYRLGMFFASAGALFLAQYYSWFVVYTLMAVCVSLGIIAMMLMGEPVVPNTPWNSNTKRKTSTWFSDMVIAPFKDFMLRPAWWLVLIFIIAFKLGDAMAGVMTNTFLIEIGFSKLEIATIVKSYGVIPTLLGAFIGGTLVHRIGIRNSLWIGGILQMLSNMMFALQAHVGYDSEMLAVTIGIENLSAGMGTAAFVAYLASLCNTSYTATQYALLSSLSATGRTWLSAGAGFLAEAFGWLPFFVITTVAALPGLLLLKLLQRHISSETAVTAQETVKDTATP